LLIDRSHVKWAVGSGLATAAAGGWYWRYATTSPTGPSGRSTEGLCFGVAGFVMILFAALLSFRRRVPAWRIGTARLWLKAHIWIALVSLPIVLFHAGFRIGGTMATVLMGLFGAVYVSGIFGLVLQQILPERIMLDCPLETIHDQIDGQLAELATRAREIVDEATGALAVALPAAAAGSAVAAATRGGGPGSVAPGGPPGARALVAFYRDEMKPYMEGEASDLATTSGRAAHVEQLRARLPPELVEAVDRLERICEERRQLLLQKRLHRWLHGWLLVHQPISMALVVLMVAHAIQAYRY
jgi:hypothetical protein